MTATIIFGTDFKAKPEKAHVDHYSTCAVNNAPALPVGPCDCGGFVPSQFVADEKDPA